jgi:hypothetical protein
MSSSAVELTTDDLCRLLDISVETIADLKARGVLMEGATPGSYLLEPSIKQYCQYLLHSHDRREVSELVNPLPQRQSAPTNATLSRGGRPLPIADIDSVRNTRRQFFGIKDSNIRSFRIYIRDARCYTVYDT